MSKKVFFPLDAKCHLCGKPLERISKYHYQKPFLSSPNWCPDHGYLWEAEMNINRVQSKCPVDVMVDGSTSRRYSPPMFGCFSCYHSASDRCLVHENGFPNIGSNCIAFDYEPGTDAEERNEN